MITRESVEFILGSIDIFSKQFVENDFEHYFYTIHKGSYRIYISEYDIPSVQYFGSIFIGENLTHFEFDSEIFEDVCRWAKNIINKK